MLKSGFLLIGLLLLISFSCSKDENNQQAKNYSISGNVQKGPYINGSNIIIYELDDQYHQTGKSFTTTTGSSGNFEFTDIPLVSPFVEVYADGFYYNEVSGALSGERLSLKAIVDISKEKSINVNILTYLEFERVKYLISNKGFSLQEAKKQAQKEILAVFDLDETGLENSEKLNIEKADDGDAVLLAVSVIMQGNNPTPMLSNLLANFVSDMKEDGTLDDTVTQASILGQAMALNCDQIRQNLIDKYAELGLSFSDSNNFKDYVAHFIANAHFKSSSPFKFPVSTSNGINVLDPGQFKFQLGTGYAFAAEMPGSGSLVIKIHKIEGSGVWWFEPMQTIGWKATTYSFSDSLQIFTSTLNGTIIDMPIVFSDFGNAVVGYYYNGSETPALEKTISWGAENNTDFTFSNYSPGGFNLLNLTDSLDIATDTSYTVGLLKPGSWDVNFELKYSGGLTVDVYNGWGLYDYNNTASEIDFKLSGKNEGDYISEIWFRISGKGNIYLSSDLEISSGKYLSRFFYVK